MNLLLDTSVLVDHLRDDRRAVELLLDANQRGDELWGSVITRTELIGGMRSQERAQTFRLLDTISWIEVTLSIADRAGTHARTYRRSHPGIDVADFLIAACAESIEARMMTRNVKHFPMFADLEPAYRGSREG